jgi:CRISP-associated protein Cas1
MLMRNHEEPPTPLLSRLRQAVNDALMAKSLDELLGIEGSAAANYFGAFAGMLKPEPGDGSLIFDFRARNRRPPRDPVNALLSLAYSLLAKDCAIAAAAVGFDPYVGFYHQPRFGRPALALDIMEEFRPLIADSVVVTLVNNRMLDESHFVRAGNAVNLTARGRRIFFEAYEARMSSGVTHPVFDYKVCYRRAIELQFRLLARVLTGEIAIYRPFVTR